jgi:hypothetical protein
LITRTPRARADCISLSNLRRASSTVGKPSFKLSVANDTMRYQTLLVDARPFRHDFCQGFPAHPSLGYACIA